MQSRDMGHVVCKQSRDARSIDGQPLAGALVRVSSRIIVSLLACWSTAVLSNNGLDGGVERGSSRATKGRVTVQAAGRGRPYLNLRDGYEPSVDFQGASGLAAALRSGAARPLALASADFDRNGTPDVLAGYGLNRAGLLSLQHGN